jgi:hypothetical protein
MTELEKYIKDKQDELLSVNLDSDLIPIANSPEELAADLKEKRCSSHDARLEQCEMEIERIKVLLLGDLDTEGSILRNERSIEEIKQTTDKILELMQHFDQMLINGLKSQNSKYSSLLENLTEKLSQLEIDLERFSKRSVLRPFRSRKRFSDTDKNMDLGGKENEVKR